jgi:hypothetical protein
MRFAFGWRKPIREDAPRDDRYQRVRGAPVSSNPAGDRSVQFATEYPSIQLRLTFVWRWIGNNEQNSLTGVQIVLMIETARLHGG